MKTKSEILSIAIDQIEAKISQALKSGDIALAEKLQVEVCSLIDKFMKANKK